MITGFFLHLLLCSEAGCTFSRIPVPDQPLSFQACAAAISRWEESKAPVTLKAWTAAKAPCGGRHEPASGVPHLRPAPRALADQQPSGLACKYREGLL